MTNQVTVIGRLVRDLELRITESGKKITDVTLAVPRSYKNVDGEYETDFIQCILWQKDAENAVEFCKKGDLVGIRGRLQTRTVLVDENTKKHVMEVIAERVSYLQSRYHDKNARDNERY